MLDGCDLRSDRSPSMKEEHPLRGLERTSDPSASKVSAEGDLISLEEGRSNFDLAVTIEKIPRSVRLCEMNALVHFA